MSANLRRYFNEAFLQLTKHGFILQSDSFLPSVSTIVTGGKLRGSWWASESAQTIFEVNEILEEHPDVLMMKLINDKVTFVHRELWGRIYSIGVARELWQLKNLTPGAKRLLKTLDGEGTLKTNSLTSTFGSKPSETARQLERRLLVHSEQVHTSSGAHARILETWPTWAKRLGFRARGKNPIAARAFLEQRLAEITMEHQPQNYFPWQI